MKAKKSTILPFLFLLSSITFAQFTAPDFTLTAHNPTTGAPGVTYNLYDILNSGKAVFIDFFYPNCGPCMYYHNTHALEKLYKAHGPDGDNTVMVFQINNNKNYGWSHITGSNAMSFNWVNGISYPTISLSGSSIHQAIISGYQAWGTPTVYKICKDKTAYKMFPLVKSSPFPFPPTDATSTAGLEKWMFDTCGITKPNTTSIYDYVTEDNNLILYPNPSKNNLFINKNYTKINIYDNLGKLVFQSKNNALKSINTSDYKNGIYFLHLVNSENEKIIEKFIISK